MSAGCRPRPPCPGAQRTSARGSCNGIGPTTPRLRSARSRNAHHPRERAPGAPDQLPTRQERLGRAAVVFLRCLLGVLAETSAIERGESGPGQIQALMGIKSAQSGAGRVSSPMRPPAHRHLGGARNAQHACVSGPAADLRGTGRGLSGGWRAAGGPRRPNGRRGGSPLCDRTRWPRPPKAGPLGATRVVSVSAA